MSPGNTAVSLLGHVLFNLGNDGTTTLPMNRSRSLASLSRETKFTPEAIKSMVSEMPEVFKLTKGPGGVDILEIVDLKNFVQQKRILKLDWAQKIFLNYQLLYIKSLPIQLVNQKIIMAN